MRVRNHLWTLAAIGMIEAIIAFVGDMGLRDFCLMFISATGALGINLTMWDE